MFDHSGDAKQPVGQLLRIGNPPQFGVQYPVAAVCDKSVDFLALAELRRARADGFDRAPGGCEAERHHFDRLWEASENRHTFVFVGDHDHSAG